MSFFFFFVNKFIVMISLSLLNNRHSIAVDTLLIRCVLEFLPLLRIFIIPRRLKHQYILVSLVKLPEQLLSLDTHAAQLRLNCAYLRLFFVVIVDLLHEALNFKLVREIVVGLERVILEAFVGAHSEATGRAGAFHLYNILILMNA